MLELIGISHAAGAVVVSSTFSMEDHFGIEDLNSPRNFNSGGPPSVHQPRSQQSAMQRTVATFTTEINNSHCHHRPSQGTEILPFSTPRRNIVAPCLDESCYPLNLSQVPIPKAIGASCAPALWTPTLRPLYVPISHIMETPLL